jgi:hypothetical protein
MSSALQSFFDSAGGDRWVPRVQWKGNGDPCEPPVMRASGLNGHWEGLNCSDGRVTTIALNASNVTGALPPELSVITSLERLDLSNNALAGRLPLVLAGMTTLRLIDLSHNELEYPTSSSERAAYNLATQRCYLPGGGTTCVGLPPVSCSAFGADYEWLYACAANDLNCVQAGGACCSHCPCGYCTGDDGSCLPYGDEDGKCYRYSCAIGGLTDTWCWIWPTFITISLMCVLGCFCRRAANQKLRRDALRMEELLSMYDEPEGSGNRIELVASAKT